MELRNIHIAREHLFSASDDLLIAATHHGNYDRERYIEPAIKTLAAAAKALGLSLVYRDDDDGKLYDAGTDKEIETIATEKEDA